MSFDDSQMPLQLKFKFYSENVLKLSELIKDNVNRYKSKPLDDNLKDQAGTSLSSAIDGAQESGA